MSFYNRTFEWDFMTSIKLEVFLKVYYVIKDKQIE